MARGRSVLTDKQDKYVEARLDGKSKRQAAITAGYSAAPPESSTDVQIALRESRQELSTATQTTRADVLTMFKEAYDMAKLSAEPASMTAAAREIGKMLGFYEPESIKVTLTSDQNALLGKFRGMSREQLAQIAAGSAKVIDGEFTHVS
jgi:phage terminase small subunit